MMDFLFEVVFSLIYEGSYELGTDKKVRKPIRILALLVFLTLTVSVLGLLLLMSISFINKGHEIWGAVMIGVTLLLACGLICKMIKRYRKGKKTC